jgi:predicted secreted protein
VELCDVNGALIERKTVGNPDFLRSGVSEYKIIKIFTDINGHSLIFLVEKTVIDDTGFSIRYMVETMRR